MLAIPSLNLHAIEGSFLEKSHSFSFNCQPQFHRWKCSSESPCVALGIDKFFLINALEDGDSCGEQQSR